MSKGLYCDFCDKRKDVSGLTRYRWVKYTSWFWSRDFCTQACMLKYLKKYEADADSK